MQANVEMSEAVKTTIEKALEATSDDPDTQKALEEMQAPVKEQWEEYKASGRTDLFDTKEWYALQTWINGDMVADPELVKALTYNAFDGLEWLEDLGMEFYDEIGQGAGALWQRTHTSKMAMFSGLYAAFYYMKACYPYLKETKGTVINFASGAGLFGNVGQCSYAAAKEGIRGLSRVAANEWGKDGINVNVVCPLAWTAQLEKFKDAYPEAYEKNVHMPPMGHYADPELEIGRACVQLASPDFKFMSGETITLEGGMGLRP